MPYEVHDRPAHDREPRAGALKSCARLIAWSVPSSSGHVGARFMLADLSLFVATLTHEVEH